MFSLKKLFGKDDKFYDLLEAGADEAKTSVSLLEGYLEQLYKTGKPPENLDEFMHSRRAEKRIRNLVLEELSRTFVTPLEREDIEALSVALYRIPKSVEKMVERLSIYPGRVPHAAFQRQAELLKLAAEAVVDMVRQLRSGTNLEKIRTATDRLHYAEGEADRIMFDLLKELYRGPYDAKELVILQEIYELAENAVDCCRNAGNIVVQIVLKHS